MVTTPGESLTRNTMPVVDAIVGKGAVPMVAGLTQDSLGYYVPTDEWMTGRNNGERKRLSKLFLQETEPASASAAQRGVASGRRLRGGRGNKPRGW